MVLVHNESGHEDDDDVECGGHVEQFGEATPDGHRNANQVGHQAGFQGCKKCSVNKVVCILN